MAEFHVNEPGVPDRSTVAMPISPSHAHRVNMTLVVIMTTVHLGALLVLPAWLLPHDTAWGWLLLVPVLLTTTGWALLHEAIHGTLTGHRRLNHVLGRLQAVLFGAPFELLRWGHLLHHGYSRTVRERSEVFEPGADHRLSFTLAYYFRLFGGLYVYEVLAGLLFLLPRALVRHLAARIGGDRDLVVPLAERVLQPGVLATVRADVLAVMTLYGLAFWLYDAHAWMLVLALAGRAALISLVDNVFHYGTPLDDMRYAHDLYLPPWASRIILHFNLHGAHHARPGVPWHALPDLHRQRGGAHQGEFLTALAAQLRGPIPAPMLKRAATPPPHAI